MNITDTSGSTFSVTITSQTQVLETTSVTSAALKTGQAITVSGSPGSNGAISARAVTILLKLPTSAQTQS
jgi:thiamine monophosphate kinase